MTFKKRLNQFMLATYDAGYYSAKMSELEYDSSEYIEYQKLLDRVIIERKNAKQALMLYDPRNDENSPR